eukprot:XP_008186324.1 PREDICTED: uncharacterized protein LOC103310297 [Acyrthosiphon pisum]
MNEEEIGVLLANWDVSEDELENSDDENLIEDENLVDDNENYLDIENLPVEFVTDEGNQYFIIPETAQTPPVNQSPSPVRQIRPQVNETRPRASQSRIPVRQTPRPVDIKNMKWKKGSLIFYENTRPHTNVPLPDNISQLSTPLQFFSLFFTDEL